MQLLRLLYVTLTSIYVERLLSGGEGRDSYDRLGSGRDDLPAARQQTSGLSDGWGK